jgi:hypothetical protein
MPDIDCELSWHLGSVSNSRSVGAAEGWDINIGEPISRQEYDYHEYHAGFLKETFSDSSFAALQQRYNDFKDAIEEAARIFRERLATTETVPSIAMTLDDMLTALRRFGDRTAHALSERYGKGSSEYRTFKEALSYEFDNMFPYRFAYHLRNYSDHRGSAPLRINEEARLGPDGTVRRVFQVLINRQTLLEGHSWHSLVRLDLERNSGDILLEAIADGMQLACIRAYCKTLLALEPSIITAVKVIRNFADRADPPTDYSPVFIEALLGVVEIWGQVNISPITIELADVAETALRQARALAT